jgi:hypothetical protein
MKIIVCFLSLLCCINFSLFCQNWQNMVPNYSFENHNLTGWNAGQNHIVFDSMTINENDSDVFSIFHGLAVQYNVQINLLSNFRVYNLGYEFSKKQNNHILGLGLNWYYSKSHGYANYSIGTRFFIELGKQYGARLGLDAYYVWRPALMNIVVEEFVAVNRPMIQMFGISPTLGGFYKTKNDRLQVILSMNFDHVIYQVFNYYQSIGVVDEWLLPESYMNFGLILKYNFLRR